MFNRSNNKTGIAALLRAPTTSNLCRETVVVDNILRNLLGSDFNDNESYIRTLVRRLKIRATRRLRAIPCRRLTRTCQGIDPTLGTGNTGINRDPRPGHFCLKSPLRGNDKFQPRATSIPILVNAICSRFCNFFSNLGKIDPRRTINLSTTRALQRPFHATCPRHPRRSLLLTSADFHTPAVGCIQRHTGTNKGICDCLFSRSFPLVKGDAP